MQLGLARTRGSIAICLFAWKAAILILAIITSIFCVLSVIDAQTADCAGQSLLLDQRSGVSDLLGPAILSAGGAIALAIRVTPERLRQYLGPDEEVTFRSILTSFGISLVAACLIGFLIGFAILTWISVKRYTAIADYCQSAAVGLPAVPSAPTR